MSLRINTNIEALVTHRHLELASKRLARSTERMSSGLRINRAADDAAGLGISEKMRAQIRGLHQASRNGQDGISLLETADGALSQVHSILQRARELMVQFNSGVLDDSAKSMISIEMIALSDEIGRIASSTSFNGVPLLRTGAINVTLQVGANSGEIITFALATLMGTINSLVNPNDFFLFTWSPADIQVLDDSINRVSVARSRFGGVQNRLEHTINALGSYRENLMAAESRIRDVDMAEEMVELTKTQIIQQSAVAMLAQANQKARFLLDLLKG